MLRRLLAVALAVAAVGCGAKGNECDTCRSDSECKKDLVCSEFNDGQKRCGTGQGTACRVR